MHSDRAAHARQFLAGLILCLAAGTATIWWILGFWLALAYAGGGTTVITFAKVAPSYQPSIEADADRERGFQ